MACSTPQRLPFHTMTSKSVFHKAFFSFSTCMMQMLCVRCRLHCTYNVFCTLSISNRSAACRLDSAASGSDVSARTAQEDGNTASPGRKASSPQSRASGSAQPWKASDSSPEPLGDIFESPGGVTGTPPESSSRPSSRNTDSSGAGDRTSALNRHADSSQDHVDGAERSPGVSAEVLASLSQGTTDAVVGGRAAAASSTAAPKRKDQFSLEISR